MDMILGASPDVISTGELTYLHDEMRKPERVCTCGKAFLDCERYGNWAKDRPEYEGELVRRIESRAGVQALLKGRISKKDAQAYRSYATSLFSHLQSVSGANVIVDSSKSAKDAAGRPLALLRLAGLDVRVLHLTRDPRATIRSYMDKGSNWVIEGYRASKPLESWRPILGWTLANRLAAQIGREVVDTRYMHVRLEDVLAHPDDVLKQIGSFAGIDLQDVARRVKAGDPFWAGHNVGGNRARLKPQKIDLTARPADQLPIGHDIGLRLFGGTVARKLGYA